MSDEDDQQRNSSVEKDMLMSDEVDRKMSPSIEREVLERTDTRSEVEVGEKRAFVSLLHLSSRRSYCLHLIFSVN
jgi:hypothetical protein